MKKEEFDYRTKPESKESKPGYHYYPKYGKKEWRAGSCFLEVLPSLVYH
jgi:hypothetical protein